MGKNLEHNKKVFEKLEQKPVSGEKSIFSRDGFIEYQNGMTDVKYGNVTAAYGGCGVIAIWNILKSFSVAPSKAVLFDEMEAGTIFGGKLGTDFLFMKKYLKKKGHQVDMYCTLRGFKKAFSRVGILCFIRKNLTVHFVAFTPAGVNDAGEFLYRFHNAAAGSYWKSWKDYDGTVAKYIENIPMTMENFLNESEVKVKVFYDVRK